MYLVIIIANRYILELEFVWLQFGAVIRLMVIPISSYFFMIDNDFIYSFTNLLCLKFVCIRLSLGQKRWNKHGNVIFYFGGTIIPWYDAASYIKLLIPISAIFIWNISQIRRICLIRFIIICSIVSIYTITTISLINSKWMMLQFVWTNRD